MKILENRGGVDRRILDEAVRALKDGAVLIYPTDTLYAFGCDALNSRAIERLCRIKGITPDKQLLSTVCADLSQAAEYARIDNRAFACLKHHLPGPFTFILPASTTLPKAFKKRRSVGVRIPDNEFARALARELGNPVLTSSVPLDDELGERPDAAAIADRYAGETDIAMAVDAGELWVTASTIVDMTESSEPEIVRQGAGVLDY
ncbi:MAG: threonylcarbamoyl-AMP synthase [Muribaculaceae bacterium]|nr:threonylcarbamoyl-AMP synthase [Muribaculaceae bacterium]MDE6612795.1 threonylcarbamoyl-AMP synthase [Muribaculaceae bacterium]